MTTGRVLHVHPPLGFGGTQKSVEVFVRSFDTDRFDHHILCLDAPGVRGEALREDGYDVTVVDDLAEAYDHVADSDVVHVHGGFERGTDIIDQAQAAEVPAVLKSTHFGRPYDGPMTQHVDRYCYVGKMILLRYLRLAGRSLAPDDWSDHHRLLYNPLILADEPPDGSRYREEFDIPATAPVLGKIGRSAPEKWEKLTVAAFERIVEMVSDAHLLLVNTPKKIRDEISARGIGDRVHYVETIPLGEIGSFHASVDVLTHASAIGECCPYVLLEAMANRTPVVVNSQPMRDNGQVELVDHGEQGFVANSVDAYAEATVELLADADRRSAMGEAGRERVETTFEAGALADRLESLYAEVLIENGVRTSEAIGWWDGPPPVTDMEAFAADYDERLRTYYDGAGVGYELERLAWSGTTALPIGRKPGYELLRKGFLFVDEYL